jgi:hypothetical protein
MNKLNKSSSDKNESRDSKGEPILLKKLKKRRREMTKWCNKLKSDNKRLKLNLRKSRAYSKTMKGDVRKEHN